MSELNIFILILIFAGILGGSFLFRKFIAKSPPEQTGRKTRYKTLFIIGAIFLPAGIVISLSQDNFAYNGLSALGLIYMFAGLANRDKWE